MRILDGLVVDPQIEFIETPYSEALFERTLIYLKAGVPVHLQGPSGIGKTTSALRLGQKLGRPMLLVFGSDSLTPADLLGCHSGYRRRIVVDQYIHSVERREEEISADWVDGRLLTACREGYTFIYDEFSRSRPETNNLLLSVLEEGVLEMPPTYKGEKYIEVHPEFRAIFTSNPEEYAGVHVRPNALLDRMVTLDLVAIDAASEQSIIASKSGLDVERAQVVVETVRRIGKQKGRGHSLRASLMIARILRSAGWPATPGDPYFDQLCKDLLGQAPTTVPKPEPQPTLQPQAESRVREVLAEPRREMQTVGDTVILRENRGVRIPTSLKGRVEPVGRRGDQWNQSTSTSTV